MQNILISQFCCRLYALRRKESIFPWYALRKFAPNTRDGASMAQRRSYYKTISIPEKWAHRYHNGRVPMGTDVGQAELAKAVRDALMATDQQHLAAILQQK